VSAFTVVRRARVAVVAAASVGLIIAGPVSLTSAHADSAGALNAKVKALLASVHSLQARATAAEQRYQQAFQSVADSESTSLSAQQQSGSIGDQADAAQSALQQRLQGLYESGGPLTNVAAMLTSGNVNEAADRNELMSSAEHAQVSDVNAAVKRAVSARTQAAAADRKASRSIGTARDVATAAAQVKTLLAAQTVLLKSANAQLNAKLKAIRAAAAALAAQTAAFATITTSSVAGLHVLAPSAQYLALYKAAAPTCPGLPWTVLAAIGQVESGHGRNPSTSSAGAMGPMQFEPATFSAYAVDGDHDGKADIMDPADAIYTAAHYLCANGGGSSSAGLSSAVFHYNHAGWYVAMVLKLAGMYATTYS
jgi:soluble lytic murein transglycosylase-like protein